MLFCHWLIIKVVLILVGVSVVDAVDRETTTQLGVFKHKPYGPFYCKARCVALCLENKLAQNVSLCVENFCSNFDENTPCNRYDSACWRNCGRRLENAYYPPLPILKINSEFDRIDGIIDPYTVRIDWEPQPGIFLYIIEIFPVKTAFAPNEQRVVQMMTTSNSYLFRKPDLCGVYMARLIAVNNDGISTPRYKRLNEWTQSLTDTDLHIRVRSMYRSTEEPFPVKVVFQYDMPKTWERGDVEILDSNVRAFDCNQEIKSGASFGDTKPDQDGFYWPVAFINESNSEIELSFPADVMYPQCKFLYKVLALKTRCGMTSTFDNGDKLNEIPFVINCQTVKNAHCSIEQPKQENDQFKVLVDPMPSNDDSHGDYLRPFVFGEPQTKFEEETTVPPSPWSNEPVDNNTLWRLFESFLRGIVEGQNENPHEPKGRRRIMPEPPPKQASVPAIDDEVQDNLTEAFIEAFKQSIDNPFDEQQTVEEDSRKPSEPAILSFMNTAALPIEKSEPIKTASEIPPNLVRVPNVRKSFLEEPPLIAAPIERVTTTQIIVFVSLVVMVVAIFVIVIWFTITRRHKRQEPKEYFVFYA